MSTYLTYMKALSDEMRLFGVWEPGNSVELGDYGIIERKEWVRQGNIFDELDVPRGLLSKTSIATNDLLEIGGVVSRSGQAKTKGKGAGAKLEFEVQFGSKGSLYLNASNYTKVTLINLRRIGAHLRTNSDWEPTFKLIYSIDKADNFTAMIGSQRTAKFSVSADAGDVPIAGGVASILTNAHWEAGSDVPVKFIGRAGNFAMQLGYLGFWSVNMRNVRLLEGEEMEDGVEVMTLEPEEIFA